MPAEQPSRAFVASEAAPFFSVVMPVLDGGRPFRLSLAALSASRFRDWELIVIDDGSQDESSSSAVAAGARLLSTAGRQGPAAARNLGAQSARGRFLFFLDADCEVHADTLERAAEILRRRPRLDALFGSYDDAPVAESFVAQYKNLQHHYVHQTSSEEASTFWAGCGAIRRELFYELGGFDDRLYSRPSIEDIELGYRLKRAGGTLHLARDVQVKHHKAWTFASWIRTDFFDRALPWTELILQGGPRLDDLNIDRRARLSVAAVAMLASALPISLVSPVSAAAVLLAGGGLLAILNRGFYSFLARSRGKLFVLRALPLHWLYYFYCGLAFSWVRVRLVFHRRRSSSESKRPPGPLPPTEPID